ncbi:hypothetical protein PanWU01x14_274410 [Parasponia andersonii]|uniref:Uncharacterized protein n=1 Tax=Parasponia andersonii TaxID=3476 RepID=A0A2P5B3I3_PARAD|nr:hypothetical protein PanWU01x14_274410 [Parasponia andersonii]
MADPTSPFYEKVHIRGHVYKPSFLNIADNVASQLVEGQEVVESPIARTAKSKKEIVATKKSLFNAIPSARISQESKDLGNLKADQIKKIERLEAIDQISYYYSSIWLLPT